MNEYMKRTGGGDGDPAVVTSWKERYPIKFGNYTKTSQSIYLTIIHMWDKQYDFSLLYSPKEQVPQNVRVDDNIGNDGDAMCGFF